MTSRFDVLTQQLFQKNIADCTVEELEELAYAHPYFAPAQYALLLKLKETGDSSYEKQYQKTILYYHDPLAFDQFINEDQYQVTENDFIATQDLQPTEAEPGNMETVISEVYENPAENETVVEPLEQSQDDVAIDNSSPETTLENKEEIIIDAVSETNKEIEQEENTIPQYKEPQTDIPVANNETTKLNPEKEQLSNDNGLVFEPYHTVDYFASQGIKLSQEEVTKDKFGKQLKSFTEWLKSMKKLPPPEQVKSLDTVAEQKVESLAAHSVESEDVYTETMAEVWMRQGNKEKAIEIYNKLSLLNPSKRAYFAAKINSLS